VPEIDYRVDRAVAEYAALERAQTDAIAVFT